LGVVNCRADGGRARDVIFRGSGGVRKDHGADEAMKP